MPIRVLFVTTTYPLKQGDAVPSFVADLAGALVRDQGVEVRVIAPHHPGAAKREVVNGVEVVRFQYSVDARRQCVAYGGGIPDNLKNYPRAKWQLPGFFGALTTAVWRQAGWADLIHAHWVEPAFLAMMANRARWARKPVVVSVHSLKPKASKVARWTLKRARRVLFNSQYTLGQAREKGYFPCDGRVVYQGHDDAVFGRQVRSNEIRTRLGIPADATVVLSLGRLIEVKGIHVLAGVADAILASQPRAHLVIAGDGPMRGEIEGIVARAGARDRVHLTGALPRAEVARLMAEADLFVNPGVVDSNGRAEGLGITTIEAMASGLACVGSRVGGITETIEDGVTGLLVPPGDGAALAGAVGGLIDDAGRRSGMGEAGRRVARERFTWPVLAGQVAEVYREVLSTEDLSHSKGLSGQTRMSAPPVKDVLEGGPGH
jgi:glycosyltransferase involved in cell wall biosynthesis